MQDEGQSGVYLTNALAKSNSGAPFFIICDSLIREVRCSGANPCKPFVGRSWEWTTVYRSDTLDGLADLIDVPVNALSDCVKTYNNAIEVNTTSELLIPRSQKILPCRINTAPFLAIPTVPGITYTMGGIVTKEKAKS